MRQTPAFEKALKEMMTKFEAHSTPAQDGEKNLREFVEGFNIPLKEGGSGSLIFNKAQERVWEQIQQCRESEQPTRLLILKARQMGISTLVSALYFALLYYHPDRQGVVIAHELEPAQKLFAKFQRYHRYNKHQRETAFNNNRFFQFAHPHNSSMRVTTADSVDALRGETYQYVHRSEIAFWRRAEEANLAIGQTIPTHWDSIDIWESTANGTENIFHQEWELAEAGKSEFVPIFLPWQSFPTYFLPMEEGEWLEKTEQDEEDQEQFDLSDEQLKWIIDRRENYCNHDQQQCDQEYPPSPERAFRSTGSPFFNLQVLNRWLDDNTGTIEEPIFYGRLEWEDRDLTRAGKAIQAWLGTYRPHVEWQEGTHGDLIIWEPYNPTYRYVIGVDVGYGIGGDWTAAHVLKVPEAQDQIEQVALWWSNKIPPTEAAVEIFKLGTAYGEAFIGVELQGPGQSLLDTLSNGHAQHPQTSSGYPNLYYHTPKGRRDAEPSPRLGWSTGSKDQKAIMLGGLQEIINSESILIRDRNTLKELAGYSRVMIQSKIGKPAREEYCPTYKNPETNTAHDDLIMSLAISYQMIRHVLDPKNQFFPARKRK